MATHLAHDEDTLLHPEGEEAWRQLRRQFELADGFWLGFVFCPSPRVVAVLRRRTEQILKFRARTLRVIRASLPEDFGEVLPALFENESTRASCIWIESIHVDVPSLQSDEPGEWTLAWDRFLLRANEHRDAIRRRFHGGIIVAAPPSVKSRARDAAPDLWSIRSLALDVQPISGSFRDRNDPDAPVTRKVADGSRDSLSGPPVDVMFGLSEAERIVRSVEGGQERSPHGLVRILMRLVDGLVEQGRTQDAVEHARKAVEVLRGQEGGDHILARALHALGTAARADNDISIALESLEESVATHRRWIEAHGETPEALRDLSISLDRAGDVRRDSGDVSGATAAYEESLALRRRLLDAYGETPQALRDLTIGLDSVGDVRRDSGDVSGAMAAYEESLALRRRLVDAYGETPQALRDLAISLDSVGDVRRDSGDVSGATAAYEESLALRRRLLDAYGETPQALRDLTVSLDRVGDVRRDSGDVSGAMAVYEESLALCRRLLDAYGETPQALRDLAMSLDRVGGVRRASGELNAAAVALDEALELYRLVVFERDSPPSLQALSEMAAIIRRRENIAEESGDRALLETLEQERRVLEARISGAHQ